MPVISWGRSGAFAARYMYDMSCDGSRRHVLMLKPPHSAGYSLLARRGWDHWQTVDVVVPIYRGSAGTRLTLLTDNFARAAAGREELTDSPDCRQTFRLRKRAVARLERSVTH